jgi:hypothetical protein
MTFLRNPMAIPLGLGLGAAAACGPKDPYDDALDIMEPVATRAALTFVDRTWDELVFVMPRDEELDIRRREIGSEREVVLWSKPTREGSELLVLTAPASEKEEEVEEKLHRFSADGEGDAVTYEVRAGFTAAALSPDYRHAVLYGAEGQLQNDNLVSIVDLEGEEARNLTLNGFGGRLSTVEFPGQTELGSPAPIQIGGHERDIVAFLAEGEVVMVDMTDAEADQVAVTFRESEGFYPVETLLRPGNRVFGDSVLFIRPQQGSDVGMLTLVDKPDEATKLPGFSAQVSLLEVGNQASDFTYYDDGNVPYLITVDSSRGALVFTDIGTHNGFDVQLAGPATNLFLRDHRTGANETVRQVVAWRVGGQHLHTLDLGDVQSTLGRNPEYRQIAGGIDQVVQLDNDRVLIGSGMTLYVVDFARDLVTPLSAQVAYDPESSALDGDLLLLGTPQQPYVSTIDLLSLTPESMVLDDPIQSFHYLPEAGKVVVTHDDPIGHVTVAQATDPSRSTSYVEWGFLLEGVFDRD